MSDLTAKLLPDDPADQHRNPAIERMMAILSVIESHPQGIGLKRISELSGVTRSTAYRILNSLTAHEMLRQTDHGAYILWRRFLSLADSVTHGADLAKAAQGPLDQLSIRLGETCKVSVYDRGFVLVVAISLGTRPSALQAQVGEHLPLHAGAGSKALMAHLKPEEWAKIRSRSFAKFTDVTLTQIDEIEAELGRVRAQGYSFDGGEFDLSVRAYGAPILAADGTLLGAISIPFHASKPHEETHVIREAAQCCAAQIAANLA